MAFSVISASDVPARATRASKTTPLRNALAALSIGEAIAVSFEEFDPEGGYRPTTISQVAGNMSARSESIKFSVRKNPESTGCFIIAGPKPEPTNVKPGRPFSKKGKAKGADAAEDAGTVEQA